MKFRYKIILALTLSSIMFNIIFGFFAIKNELDGEKERFQNKIEHFNSLMQLMNVRPLWDFDLEKIQSNLDLVFRDPEVVAVSLRDITGTINISIKNDIQTGTGKIIPHKLVILKDGDKLGEAQIEYSNSIYSSRLRALIIERVVLTLGLILINIAVVFLISSYLLKPIDSVVNGLRKIDEGDFNYRMNINSADEFKEIEVYFNRMVATLSMEIKSRIEKEEQLVEIHKYLENVFNSIPSVLISVDSSGYINQWNCAAEKFTSIKLSDASGKSVWKLIPILEKYMNAFTAVILEEKTEEIRRQYVSPEKDQYINISISPLITNRGSGAVIRLDDVTEMKQKDEKLSHAQMMDTIGNLAGGLAHDFNNVLAGITGTISLIKFRMERGDELSRDELAKFLNVMGESGIRAADLTKQILALSRREEMDLRTVDLNLIIKHVIEFCSHTLDKSVEINAEFLDPEALVLADSVRLEQVLLNLCINASHAMTVMRKEGEVRGGDILITIENYIADEFFCNVHTEAIPGVSYWRVSVMDNGVGMDKKILKKIFEPFFTTKGKGRGSGLGLSMSYNIIKQHNGFIDVYSEPGKGSIFSVYLPVNENAIEEKLTKECTISPDSECGLILVVDDENSMCEIASSMLGIFGYDVITADDAEKGIELFKENHQSIRAVLLDMVMPKKTGGELFLIFREINPSIPIVLTSGFSKDEEIDNMLKYGNSYFIQKPFLMDSLASVISKAVKS
jgi:PAS domain S-box-containing protein